MRTWMGLALAGLSLSAVNGAARAAHGEGKEAPNLFNLVSLDEVSVPIVENDRADGTLQIKLVLQARDAASAERLTATLPVLRAATVGAALEFGRLYASPMVPVDVRRLTTELDAALRSADPGIARVLVVKVAAVRS